MPCAISFGGVGKINQSSSVATATKDCNLFVRPEIEIFPNDIIQVQRNGRTTEYLAGECKDYDSHNEITLIKKVGEV